MELLVVTFVFAATILSVPTEAFLFRSLRPVDFTDNADQKIAATTAHLLTGSSHTSYLSFLVRHHIF